MREACARPGGVRLKVRRPESEDRRIVGREARLDDSDCGDRERGVEDGVISKERVRSAGRVLFAQVDESVKKRTVYSHPHG